MSDTWRENAIVQAIQIIADKKIAQAGFDKTIKGVINKVLDKTTGKYEVRYQDSLFEAYATSAKIEYVKDQQVSVLIPGNDWDRVKTILGGVDNVATNYQQIPIAGQQYNNLGPNGSSLSKNIELSSYVDSVIDLGSSYLTIRDDLVDYVKKGDSIALGMVVRTAFAGTQIGGNYGLTFRLKFKDSVTGSQTIKTFNVDTSDVIGHPYQLTSDTLVETLIKNVDTQNFIGIGSIQAFCDGFPLDESKTNIKDIIISDVRINGASALTEDELNGYVLHIDDSENGNTLDTREITPVEKQVSKVLLKAVLKVNGKTTTENVVYYWFRQNGTIFRGDVGKYSGYAGDGWECLNVYTSGGFVPKTKNIFTFNTSKDDLNKDSALAVQRVNKILCVAVYDNKQWIKGEIEVINMNVNNNFYISTKQSIGAVSDDPAKTIYYLDNGTPTLVCNTEGLNEEEGDIEYIWSVKLARGKGEKKQVTTNLNNQYAAAAIQWQRVQNRANNMAVASAEQYKENAEYINAKQNFELVQFAQRIEGNQYINFPISTIQDYSIISCAVKQNGNYKGTASITLYNRTQLEGMYSLNLEHGTQVFQYDGKGNSPTSPQIEKPLELLPLTFTLINNEGVQVTHEQIRNNGHIKWIIPNKQTLLSSNEQGGETGATDLTVTRADLPFAADNYTVYSGLDSFSYSIADQYDSKCNINYIWLNVKFKDIILDAYTDFTFPKDGDPGTNGTDFVAKLSPSTDTDRIYISDKAQTVIFDDNGATVANLKFQLYNNSKVVSSAVANYWNCPPITQSSYGSDNKRTNTTYLAQNPDWSKPQLNVVGKTLANIQSDKPVNIIRAQHGTGSEQGDLKYFAEYPVCTQFVNTEDYRLKIKPKTGFKYVVYSEDGSRPDYDNTLPFEIIVEKVNGSYWEVDNTSRTYTWYAIGSLEPATLTGKTVSFKPKDKFDGSDLTSALVCEVSDVGRIHIPIYMILNRYGHSALNGWDGNSIQLNANGDTILAPQIGAGKKESDNTYTGVLMGDVKSGSTTETGVMGYQHGQRSIFLDAKTGNATFGKPGASQIKITASSGQGTIQSGDYNYSTTDHTGTGMKIKFSSTGNGIEQGPYIRYGSNKFSVSADGSIHAAGSGDIAGWNITDTRLYKNNTGMASSGLTTNNIGGSLPNTTASVAFHAGTSSNKNNFYVTHDGYLYSRSGRIAKWDISQNRLSDGNVGMGQMTSNDYISANTFNNQSSQITNGRIWANNNFVVDNNGKLWSKSGQIGPWALTNTELTDGNTGLGTKSISATNMNSAFGTGTTSSAVAARIWALGTNGSDSTANFVVSNTGQLYSKSGKIGGWNIQKDKLWATSSDDSGNGIRIKSNGSMNGGNGTVGSWAINNDGSSSFNKITATNMTATTGTITDFTANNIIANNGGQIGGWTIGASTLTGGGITINSNSGSISADGWSITGGGDGYFKNLYGSIKSGQSLTGGSGGGSYSLPGGGAASLGNAMLAGDFKIDGQDNKTYIKDLVVDKLEVLGSLSVMGYSVGWRSLIYLYDFTPRTISISGEGFGPVQVMTGVSAWHYRSCLALCSQPSSS